MDELEQFLLAAVAQAPKLKLKLPLGYITQDREAKVITLRAWVAKSKDQEPLNIILPPKIPGGAHTRIPKMHIRFIRICG